MRGSARDQHKEVLRDYYTRSFPRIWNQVLKRLVTCDGRFKLEQCEIVPRDLKSDGHDVMNRHVFFRSDKELFTYCLRWLPLTLQLGGIYPMLYTEDRDDRQCKDVDVMLVKAGAYATQKPFVVDIDMNEEYDRKGICRCQKTQTCKLCWYHYMHSARVIVDYLLRNICKLRNVSHFWSGRRGIHIWCSDPRAIAWSNAERVNVVEKFSNRDALLHLLPLELHKLPWPRFDYDVSADARHCIGLPFMPHHSTTCIRIMLPPLSSDVVFDPEERLKTVRLSKQAPDDFQHGVECLKTILNE
jgi:DNA primase catalytic subunit